MGMRNLVSFLGVFVLIAIAWACSANRRNVNLRVLAWGIALQLVVAAFIFIVPAGTQLFLLVNDVVIRVMDSASAGARFVFGRLALSPGQVDETGQTSLGFMLAFQAFPTIIFFSALISVLYFLKIMPLVIHGFAYLFTRLMRISGAESLVAASNIFAGVESALTVRPYLARMTRSELCVLLTAGMATVSSNVLALYVLSLKQYFPTIAGHLVSASLLSAPAAILMAKVIVPEDGKPETLGVCVRPHYDRDGNLFQAVIDGANAGLKMIVGIVALLVAVLGLVALADLVLPFLGGKVNQAIGANVAWSLKDICGYLFYPFTLIIGIDPRDASIVSRIIGERIVVTEVISYQDLAAALADGALADPRSVVITTYALCGFAHVASMAIFVGGTAALAPSRTADLSKVAVRALIAATLACFMTACVAGTFFTKTSVLLGSR